MNQLSRRIFRGIVALTLGLLFTATHAAAHEDEGPRLAKVEKVYAAPTPLGSLRVVYTNPPGKGPQALSVECDLFRRAVPATGLTDLPGPNWGVFDVFYSLTTVDPATNGLVNRPYFYVVVPLHGPGGERWNQTWATFHFDADGKLTRRVKRFVPDERSNSIRVLWEPWPVGSGASAQSILEAAGKR